MTLDEILAETVPAAVAERYAALERDHEELTRRHQALLELLKRALVVLDCAGSIDIETAATRLGMEPKDAAEALAELRIAGRRQPAWRAGLRRGPGAVRLE